MIRISYHAVIVVSSIKSNSRRKCTQTIPASRPKPRRFDTQSYYLRGRPGIITYSLSWNGDSTRPPLSHRLRSNVIIEKNNSSACSHVSFDLLSSKKLNKLATNLLDPGCFEISLSSRNRRSNDWWKKKFSLFLSKLCRRST